MCERPEDFVCWSCFVTSFETTNPCMSPPLYFLVQLCLESWLARILGNIPEVGSVLWDTCLLWRAGHLHQGTSGAGDEWDRRGEFTSAGPELQQLLSSACSCTAQEIRLCLVSRHAVQWEESSKLVIPELVIDPCSVFFPWAGYGVSKARNTVFL